MNPLDLLRFLQQTRDDNMQRVREVAAQAMGSQYAQNALRALSFLDAQDDAFRTGINPLVQTGRYVTGHADEQELLEAWLMNMAQSPEERVGERVGQAIAHGTAYDPVTSFGMGGDIAAAAANPMTWVDFGLGALAGRIGRGLGLSAETAERLANAPGLRRLADRDTVPEPVRATGMTPGGRPTKHFSPERIAAVESALRNNINRDELNRIVQLGRERGGDRWYSGNTILERFTRALGNEEQATELFRVIAALTAATSPRTQVTDNIDRALNLAAEAFAGRPISELQEVAKGVMGRFNPNKSLRAAMFAKGPVTQVWEEGALSGQKVSSFLANFLDNVNAVTIDTHNLPMVFYLAGMDWRDAAGRRAIADLIGMDPDDAARMAAGDFREAFYSNVTSGQNDYLYSAIERVQQELAQELGVTPRELQALLWVGGKEITGVANTTPFPDLFMSAIEKAAAARNTTFDDIVQRLYNGQLNLAEVVPPDVQRILLRAAGAGAEWDGGEDDFDFLRQALELGGYSTGGRF